MAEGGDLDFDPIGEGKIDINDFNDDDLKPLLEPTDDSGGESWRSRFRKYFSRRNVNVNESELDAFRKGENESDHDWGNRIRKNVVEEIQMERLDMKAKAGNRIKHLYPNWDPKESKFLFTLDEYDRVTAKLKTSNQRAKSYLLEDYKNLPDTIKENLGHDTNEIAEFNEIKGNIDGMFPNNKLNNTLTDKSGIEYDLQYDEDGEIEITRDGLGSWYKLYNKNGEINKRLPKAIKTVLGDEAKVIIDRNEAAVVAKDEEISELRGEESPISEQIEAANASLQQIEDNIHSFNESRLTAAGNEIDTINERIIMATREKNTLTERLNLLTKALDDIRERLNEKVTEAVQLAERNEEIEANMPLKQRIKAIFKKYGFTVTAVVTAVGVIIGVIIKSLTSGLATVAKGVGNGLKTIGKKLGQILPGMVGAIASFIFRTAGEVVGFLAKNAWLLIVAVVLYFVEQYKNKR
jgi:archaellum component FlaC